MRRFVMIVVALAFALSTTAVSSDARLRDRGKPDKSKAQMYSEVEHMICAFTRPWPFNKCDGHGTTDRDSDGDGVMDSRDRCPNTPKGAEVDRYGCPTAADADGDGVPDGVDKCADTPRGARVDASGCPMDSDGDGVPDGIDRCSGTPKGAKVDRNGCPADADGDGVADGVDRCPNTPEGARVNADGCAIDSDGDGVADGIDRCPNTPNNLEVNDMGCPVEISETETEFLDSGMIRTSLINFESGSASIKSASYPILDEIGNILVQWPKLKIEIGGHTDSQGSESLNQRLSDERAQAVLSYLTSNFDVKGSQFSTKGYGESSPIASNSTADGRKRNRRVEFTVLNRDELKREIERRGFKNR